MFLTVLQPAEHRWLLCSFHAISLHQFLAATAPKRLWDSLPGKRETGRKHTRSHDEHKTYGPENRRVSDCGPTGQDGTQPPAPLPCARLTSQTAPLHAKLLWSS